MAKSKCKFDFGTFDNEGDVMNIVGRTDLFKSKEDFLDACNEEYDFVMEDREYTVKDVKEGYVKYLNYGYGENDTPAYYLVNQSKGATKVYHIDF